MLLSIIIPTLNEEDQIGNLLEFLVDQIQGQEIEIIVSDAGSSDKTHEIATKYSIIWIEAKVRSRAIQMNLASKIAKGKTLYFVHADSIPPIGFVNDIMTEISNKNLIGGYRFKFKTNKKILTVNSWFTRFNKLSFRGGDQTLFIDKGVFDSLGRYKKEYSIMEEYELMLRAKAAGYSFKLIPKDVLVSDRKYENNSYFRVNMANLVAMYMFRKGRSPELIKKKYYAMLNHPKDD